MRLIAFNSFRVIVPLGWEDVTDSLETDEPPPTLARDDGVGALQFSVALYTGGVVPDPSPEQLSHMVATFAETRGLGAPRHVAAEPGPLRLAAASFIWGEDFLRVWQVSDGRSFAMVTYTCESGQEGQELGDCEQIVRSLEFPQLRNPRGSDTTRMVGDGGREHGGRPGGGDPAAHR